MLVVMLVPFVSRHCIRRSLLCRQHLGFLALQSLQRRLLDGLFARVYRVEQQMSEMDAASI
jgi:hypothetical protein